MLDLTEVLSDEGKEIQREVDLALESLSYRFGTFEIIRKTPLLLTVTNIGDRKLLLRGNAQLEVSIPCARCLEPVAVRLEIPLDHELELENKDYIDGYNLNVDQLVHDEALLVWPERTLCREDCRGLCGVCGQNLNKGSCNCESTDLDPRMAKVLDIFSKFKEV